MKRTMIGSPEQRSLRIVGDRRSSRLCALPGCAPCQEFKSVKKQFGINFLNEFEHSYLGALKIKYDYRHISQVEDWKNGNIRAKVDSSDIMNLSLSKKINMADWSINIFNLTDEVYQRPDTYNQERRRISLGFRKSY